MNPRIQTLWNEAAKSTAAFPSGQNNSWETQVNFMDKFAELIVRECAGACLHDDWEDPRWGRFYANKIKQHFGVE